MAVICIGDRKLVGGYVTKAKYVMGCRGEELEASLGYQRGRLSRGGVILALTRLPLESEFELAAYSMVAEHRYVQPSNLDIGKLKDLARGSWTLRGPDSLVKIWPTTQHDPGMDPDDQYPPGKGVPQWRLVRGAKVPAVVIAVF